jgi:uncharacterized membrane protein YfcA
MSVGAWGGALLANQIKGPHLRLIFGVFVSCVGVYLVYINGNLKQKIRSGMPARSQKDLIKKTRSFMKTLQRRPHHVRGYFKHPMAAYAA